ncbi:transcription termination factor MTERF5, chloroplastic-like [Macadamia integrifolia]|uniref:transcription termination factor MTERF5, chloroplastic-like n=1 Tax=Macadamia integrifolia TaxID=60698 RepID=UPI001C5023B8|nr:transcription termination factor MTERF5, chloroplastic-like [Macadamia integrifolia]XP_042488556.1 transcription termination factor MTERF5, chloroplastic-like [Macadamia integrifolia]
MKMKLKLAAPKLPLFRFPVSPIYHISFKSSTLCSSTSPSEPSVQVSESSPFMVDYFIRSFGWPREKAVHASKRLLHIKSPQKPDTVLAFLRGIGLSESQLSATISRRPSIITAGIESSLLPKVKIFESLGASGKELADLVVSSANCLGNSVDRRILPCIDVLRDILQDDKKVRFALKRCPWVLSSDPDKVLRRNVGFLLQKGLEGPPLSTLIYKSPKVLVMKLEQLAVACQIVEQFGLTCSSSPEAYANVLYVVTTVSKEKLSRKLDIFSNFGFEESDKYVLFKSSPSVFRLNEENLKCKLDFFLSTMDNPRELLLKCPLIMGLSMETRLMPRYRWIQKLRSMGLVSRKIDYAAAFCVIEDKFVKRYVNKFKNMDGLDLLGAYKEFRKERSGNLRKDPELKAVV